MVLVKQFGKELGHDWIIFRSPNRMGGGGGGGERKKKKEKRHTL